MAHLKTVEEADERKNREEAEDEGEGEEDHEDGEKSKKGERAGNPSFGPGVSRAGGRSGDATWICLTVAILCFILRGPSAG